MRWRVNIAPAASLNNGRPGRTRRHALLAIPMAILAAGCATAPPVPSAPVPVWELASAEPVTPQRIIRTRVSYDRPLPPRVAQKLCDEFSLICIETPGDWAEVSRRLQLADPPEPVDFGEGMIVGILASVGEFAHRDWPVSIASVRTRTGVGWLEAALKPGLYHPLKTAGYLELAYVPGLHSVCMVRVAYRTFVIRSPMPTY